jgi:hypothetical protein
MPSAGIFHSTTRRSLCGANNIDIHHAGPLRRGNCNVCRRSSHRGVNAPVEVCRFKERNARGVIPCRSLTFQSPLVI